MASTDAPVRHRTLWNQGPTFRRATTGLIVTTDGFEDGEFSYPFYRLRVAGFIVDVATPDGESVTGTHVYEFDAAAIDAHDPDWWADSYDLLVVPGGVRPRGHRRDRRLAFGLFRPPRPGPPDTGRCMLFSRRPPGAGRPWRRTETASRSRREIRDRRI